MQDPDNPDIWRAEPLTRDHKPESLGEYHISAHFDRGAEPLSSYKRYCTGTVRKFRKNFGMRQLKTQNIWKKILATDPDQQKYVLCRLIRGMDPDPDP